MVEQAARMRDLPLSGIRKMFEMAGKDAINFGIGEPDFQPPDFVIDAYTRAMREGKNNYGPSSGIPELRAAIAEKERPRLPTIDASHVVVTTGSTSGLYATIASFIDPGDEVLMPNPGFVLYRPHTVLVGGVPVYYPLRKEFHYRPRVDDLRQLVTPRTKAIIVNSPSNPTGACLREKDVDYIVEFAREHGLLLITDEAYDTITYDRPHASFLGKYEQTVYLNTFSKAYAMTGWRIGYIVAPPDLAEPIKRMNYHLVACPATPTQYACLAALEGPQDFVHGMVQTFRERRDLVVKLVKEVPGLDIVKPEGAFYAFCSYDYDVECTDLALHLLKRKNVVVTPGNAFGDLGAGHIRLSYATSESTIREGLRRIYHAFEDLAAGKPLK
jgi:aspartate aminotransferase